MDLDRWRKVEELYHAARECGRQVLVNADSGLRNEVESLLDQDSLADCVVAPGTKFGPYEIVRRIGAGGMGEVYSARDTRLGREVAVKLARERFSERFEREARAVAALNHPNICHLYDVGPNYLVMELIEGPTLADRIKEGPIPLDEALEIARQIADALEAAGEKGIVHRDLKPANVKIKPDGAVKVLDFGLAKLVGSPTVQTDASLTPMPAVTEPGMIFGTAAYMSPEQALGKVVDKRADIWAFGVVLYEMLTAKRLFDGPTTSDSLAAVLTKEPDLALVPMKLRRLLASCLQKDPKKRLGDIGDAIWMVEDASQPKGRQSRLYWGVLAVLLLLLAAVPLILFRDAPTRSRMITTNIEPPEDTTFDFDSGLNLPALSPDGRQMVFGAQYLNGQTQLWVRQLDSTTAVSLSGTESARFPFWSPDSRSVGFFADGKLKRVDVAGGPVQTLADAPSPRGGSWNSEGVIVFAPNLDGPLQRVTADGGSLARATTLDPSNDFSHGFPWFLPDGHHFLFADYREPGRPEIMLRLGALDSAEVKTIAPTNSSAVYASGYLLYLRKNTLMAQPFDRKRLQVTGEAVPVVDQVKSVNFLGEHAGVFSASTDGLLAYGTAAEFERQQLTWFDRQGKQVGTLATETEYHSLELSPDRKYTAVTRDGNIWVNDVARGLATRLTFNVLDIFGIWSPDGTYIAYSSERRGHNDLYRKAADGARSEELLYADGAVKIPTGWSPDGKFLLFFRIDPKTQRDLWVLPIGGQAPGGSPKPFPWLATPFNEFYAKFSPDGRWIAYQSDESGRDEIYVAAFPGPGSRHQISTGGGSYPRWRADGNEIFYVGPNGRIIEAEVFRRLDGIELGGSQALPIPVVVNNNSYMYDISADGRRFLVATPRERRSSVPLTLIQSWTAVLKKTD